MQQITGRLFLCSIICCFFYLKSISQQQTIYLPRKGNSTSTTIYNNTNAVIGDITYYGFSGSYNVANSNESIAKTFSILVSGVTDYSNNAERIKGEIEFSVSELYPNSKKTMTVGELNFTVTILRVQKYSDPQFYIMGSVGVKIDVDYPLALIQPVPNNNPVNNPSDNNSSQGDNEPVRKILENGTVEIDYADGSKKIISDGSITFISPDGRTSMESFDTAAPFVPPDLPNDDINRWLNSLNARLYTLISQLLKNDQTSINNLTAGESGLNIYQVINRRFKFLQSLN